ncbi:MAG: extracellular solute-binding protein [Chloroflexi bacterium]|nr:extracellular solute-binding protein [Chloroflexota bacterium]
MAMPSGLIARRVTRRQGIVAAQLGVLAAALGVGCEAGGRGDAEPAKKTAGPVEIEHWNTLNPEHPESVARMGVLDEFAKRHPDVVRVTHGQNATSQALDKFKAAMAAGSPPNIAVFFQYRASDLLTSGGLVDLNEVLKKEKDWAGTKNDLYTKVVAANVWKNRLFGVPIYNSYFNMYFNRERLKQAGLGAPKQGWTWNEFVEVVRKAAKPPDVWGYNSGWITAHHRMWAGSNGGSFLNKDGAKVTLAAPENVDAVQFKLDLVKQGVMRGASERYAELLATGGVVFQFAVPARLPLYKKDNVDFGTTMYPIGPRNQKKEPYTVGAAYAFNVFRAANRDTEHVAALAAKWAAQRDGQMLIARLAGVPISNRSVVESAAFKQEYAKDEPYWPFIEVLPYFEPYPNYPKFQEPYDALNVQVQRVWKGEASPREAMAEAERQVQLLLDESLRLG